MRLHQHLLAIVILGLCGCAGQVDDGSGPGSSCPPDEAFFRAYLWQPTLSSKCITCHNPTGLAQGSRFVLHAGDDDATMTANLQVTARIAAVTEGGTSVLLLRPTGQYPGGHPGGTLFLPGSSEYASFASFVARVLGSPGACTSDPGASCVKDDPLPGRRRLRRLSRDEYDATVADLFGVASTHGQAFVPDVVVNGFDNDADALTVSPLLADQLGQAAEDIAAQVATPARLATFAPCATPGTAAAARVCAEAFVRTQGERIYRRPVDDDEVTRLLAVYDVGAGTASSYAAGIELTITAMLESPSFLYRSELGALGADGRYALDDHELASELSYFLVGSMPDDELVAAARAGKLGDPVELERQARRLLGSPRSRVVVARFAARWLDLTQLRTVVKDEQIFAGFTPEVRDALGDEASGFVADVALGAGTFEDLLTRPVAPPTNAVLSDFYAAPAGAPARAGVLELGALLATHGRPNSTSPIHRGKLVRERLLCQPLPPPPPGLNAQPPGLDPSLTTRARYGAHSHLDACKGCHRLMDPIGFGFEHFDGVGRWRADEGGLAIDDSGEIVDTSGGTFKGTAELAGRLAASVEARACFARQWVRFAWGTGDSADAQCAQTAVMDAFVAGGGRVDELMVALVLSPHFRFREEAAVGGGGGTGDMPDAGSSAPADAEVAAGLPDAGPPAEIAVANMITSEWAGGYCARVTVTNVTDHAVTWSVDLKVDGTINNHWSAVMTALPDGTIRFTGESYDASVAAGEVVEFGYCAVR